MKVTFNGINNIPSVFTDVSQQKQLPVNYKTTPINTADTVEIKTKKQPFYKNKKLLFSVGLLSLSALAIYYSCVRKKRADAAIEALKQHQLLPKYLQVQQNDGLVKQVNVAREHLIDEVKANNETLFNSVSFFGPDSANKTMIKEGLVKELSGAGYQIERMPELKDSSIEEIGLKIDKAIRGAKKRFETTGKRTAIVINELDKIAPDRQKTGIYKAARPLLNYLQDCGKQGFTVVADEYSLSAIDPAVSRRGRFSLHILTEPLENESKEIWQKYLDFINEFANPKDREELVKRALSILNKK